jgi:hypothetical protein
MVGLRAFLSRLRCIPLLKHRFVYFHTVFELHIVILFLINISLSIGQFRQFEMAQPLPCASAFAAGLEVVDERQAY